MVQFDPSLHFRSLEELNAALLMRRDGDDDDNCISCNGAPKCKECPDGEVCSFTIPNCDTCAESICIEDDTANADDDDSDDGPNTGAIAGGVVGGVAAIAIITYLVWRFCIKAKRDRSSKSDLYEGGGEQRTPREKGGETNRDHRSSVHTVHSIASTVLTRASNIIQIAYIPGVTNRTAPNSPGLLVPPVPPIPMHAANGNGNGSAPNSAPNSAVNSPTSFEDQHFFTPGALRDSTYSGLSGESQRDSYARNSQYPRSSIAPSIASTIYGKNAVVVAPAQTGMRAKAAMVSVKSFNGSTGENESIPDVPSINYEKFEGEKPRDSTFSVGSTFLNNANTATATQARAQVIKVGGANQIKQINVNTKSEAGSSNPSSPADSHPTSPASGSLKPAASPRSSPAVDQGPFCDPPSPDPGNKSTKSLSAVIEEATKRAASGPDRKSKRQSEAENVRRGTSPFGDEHATKE